MHALRDQAAAETSRIDQLYLQGVRVCVYVCKVCAIVLHESHLLREYSTYSISYYNFFVCVIQHSLRLAIENELQSLCIRTSVNVLVSLSLSLSLSVCVCVCVCVCVVAV